VTTRWARFPLLQLWALVFAGVLYALLTIYTYLTSLSFDEAASTASIVRAGGEGTLLPPANLLGGALAIAFGAATATAMMLRMPARLLALPAVAVIAIGIVLTYSRGSWVAAAVSALVVLGFATWRDRGRVLVFATALCAVVLGALTIAGSDWQQRVEQLTLDYIVHDTAVLGRFAWWDESYRLFLRSPIFGNGLDAYVAVNPWGTHNHWLELLAGVGLAGTLPIVGALVSCVVMAIAALLTPRLSPSLSTILVASLAAVTSFAVWSLAESVHSDRRIIAFLWAALGMGLGAAMRARQGVDLTSP
jgi:O-antigen ligase